ncbi:MAG: hypothetical protein ACOCYB_11395 [Alkalispirochaeta sp.]
MHTRKVRRYVIVPFVYLAAIFGLLYLQFSGTLTVRHTVGDLRFSGTLVPGADETSRRITAARAEYEGLIFEFSEDNPIIIAQDDGEDLRLHPEEFELDGEQLHVYLSDGSAVRFEVITTEPPELHVLPMRTRDWPEEGQLLLPYRVSSEARSEQSDSDGPETRAIAFEDRQFFLSTPPRTVFDAQQQRMILPLSTSTQMVRYAEVTTDREDVIESAFGDGGNQISSAAYDNAVDEYIETAYESWGGSRFNGGSGTWDIRDRAPRFSEEILTAYLAEAWDRNEYTTAFNQMRRAADIHPEQVGFKSSVFLGNLRTVTSRFLSQDRQRTDSLSSRIQSDDATIFREEDLVEFAALRGSEDLYRELIQFVEEVDFRTVDLPSAVGMLSAAVSQPHPSEAISDATERFSAIVDDRILPSVRQFEDYFFIETAQSEVDVYWSIRAGQLLLEIGRVQGNQLYRTVGRNLVLSGLELADEDGFLPEFLFFGDSGLQSREGSFGPERLYPHLTDNPSYPRLISLYDSLGAGSFIWTVADFTDISIGDEQYQFTLRYPEDRTHYILMQGIPSFESMQLFGLQWRNDPQFESYIKGRHYESSSNTLMIKYTDDSTEEDIILNY